MYEVDHIGIGVYSLDVDGLELADMEIFVPTDDPSFFPDVHTQYGMWCPLKPIALGNGQFIVLPGKELPRWVSLAPSQYEIGMEVILIAGVHAGRIDRLVDRVTTVARDYWVTASGKTLTVGTEEVGRTLTIRIGTVTLAPLPFAALWPDGVPFEDILGAQYRFPPGTKVEYPQDAILRPGVVIAYGQGRAHVLDLLDDLIYRVAPSVLRPYVDRHMVRGSVPPAVKPKARTPHPGLPPGALPSKGTPSED